MGRLFTPLVTGVLGLLVGAYLAGVLVDRMLLTTPPGVWQDVILVGFAGLTGLLFGVIGAWLDGAVDTNHLAVTPLRHLMTLTYTIIGALFGALLFWGLTQLTGPLDQSVARLFGGVLMAIFAFAGFDRGRRAAAALIY